MNRLAQKCTPSSTISYMLILNLHLPSVLTLKSGKTKQLWSLRWKRLLTTEPVTWLVEAEPPIRCSSSSSLCSSTREAKQKSEWVMVGQVKVASASESGLVGEFEFELLVLGWRMRSRMIGGGSIGRRSAFSPRPHCKSQSNDSSQQPVLHPR